MENPNHEWCIFQHHGSHMGNKNPLSPTYSWISWTKSWGHNGDIHGILVQCGTPKIAFSWFIFVAEKTMVYGRYNYSTTIVNGDYFMVYKPTHIWKASPRDIWKALQKIHGEFLSKSRPFVGHGGANVGI